MYRTVCVQVSRRPALPCPALPYLVTSALSFLESWIRELGKRGKKEKRKVEEEEEGGRLCCASFVLFPGDCFFFSLRLVIRNVHYLMIEYVDFSAAFSFYREEQKGLQGTRKGCIFCFLSYFPGTGARGFRRSTYQVL